MKKISQHILVRDYVGVLFVKTSGFTEYQILLPQRKLSTLFKNVPLLAKILERSLESPVIFITDSQTPSAHPVLRLFSSILGLLRI